MKITRKTVLWYSVFVVLLAVPVRYAIGQEFSKLGIAAPGLDLPASTSVLPSEFSAGEILREIDDPHTGDRWLLLRDQSHPAAPGRLVRVTARSKCEKRNIEESGRCAAQSPIIQKARPCPILRAGDRLIAVESSAVLDGQLEAVALGPATAGSPLYVRLKFGGTVVRAIAQAPGRVILLPAAAGEWR
jgi:hypothetical protein